MALEKYRLNGASGWVLALIATGGILITVGGLWRDVWISTECNQRQDDAIATLRQDVAVIKASTTRTAEDIHELKTDVKKLLSRP